MDDVPSLEAKIFLVAPHTREAAARSPAQTQDFGPPVLGTTVRWCRSPLILKMSAATPARGRRQSRKPSQIGDVSLDAGVFHVSSLQCVCITLLFDRLRPSP